MNEHVLTMYCEANRYVSNKNEIDIENERKTNSSK